VSEQLLTILKLCLLVLLYLFFLRVLRAVWAEVKAPRPAVVAGGAPAGGAVPAARVKEKKQKRPRGQPSKLTVVNPPEQRGRSFALGQELSVGRAAGCVITLDDTFVSQLHARVFQQDGQVFVEDLGSTNGTYLNSQKVSGPMVMGRGDQLRVGDTVMELT
jgi:pSer/pThr/pTyr-binding forkhead associated (FHA) protein